MLQESSIDEPQIRDFEPTFHDDITYTVVNGATKHGKAMLIDNQRYTYNIKRRRLNVTDWQCSVRPKDHPWRATVKQKNNDLFEWNTCSHNHPGEPGAITAAKISVSVKQKATEDLFKPASAIVDEVFLDSIDDRPCPSLPKPANLARAANRLRQRQRPNDPTDLEFVLQEEHIPAGFLQKDIHVREKRHLVFATEQQLNKLNSAKTWYIDGTFKLCRHPFTQLVTINAFVRSDDLIKQVPLVSVLMSGKKRDYTKVLKSIVHLLPNPVVQKVVIDFESAIWGALRQVLPSVVIMGCVFHWTQALWHKIQALGLQAAYSLTMACSNFSGGLWLYHSCIMARLPMCSTNFYQRPQQHHYKSSWNMFKTHGSTAMFCHLPAGVCTRKLFAPTTM